jgi:hypothetical protein
VRTFTRPLRYRQQLIQNRDGTLSQGFVGQEKGIDIRLAIDVVKFARNGDYREEHN